MQVQLQQPGYPLHKAAKKRGDNDTLIQVPGMKCVADLTPCACRTEVACMQTRCNIAHHGPCGGLPMQEYPASVLRCLNVLAV